ncbi:PREDICTED: opioid-binding protein/cell adhesion molecule-like [Polistes dominula]|uniref:Opioid-binding protein/cell adhesion molecule-like n=1 Tax=Polistes dominula TaxID=743375 RepID=A0ABM1IVU9_POLDO|nr:PREDICTED: opioid-binding protein/cell adhesion molecule-like [Polistes dominula]
MIPLSWIICILAIGVNASVNESFGNHPTVVKVFRNHTVLLPCSVQDLGVPTRVKWWGNGSPLADSDDPKLIIPERIRLWQNLSLEISNVQPGDTGEYVCQASRPTPWGYVTRVHVIEVMYPPSIHTIPESGVLEVSLKEEVNMECVPSGVPTPVVSWWAKEENILLLTNKPQLRFYVDHRNRSGQYTCIADNGIGDPALATIDLRVKYKPEIIIHKPWVHASPGLRTQLDCNVIAWPDPEVEWFFTNTTIPYSTRIMKHSSGHNHSLMIKNVMTKDYGFYLCRAWNSLGITEAVIQLSGAANPAVFKEVKSISKTAFNFIWEVDCYTPIVEYLFSFRRYKKYISEDEDSDEMTMAYKWHRLYIPSGSNAIGPVHARSFNLTGLDEATHYEAFVVSRNRYGFSRPSKIIKFATEGAPPDAEDYYKTTKEVPEEKINTVIQLASVSQQSSVDNNNGCTSMTKKSIALVVFFSLLCSNIRLL